MNPYPQTSHGSFYTMSAIHEHWTYKRHPPAVYLCPVYIYISMGVITDNCPHYVNISLDWPVFQLAGEWNGSGMGKGVISTLHQAWPCVRNRHKQLLWLTVFHSFMGWSGILFRVSDQVTPSPDCVNMSLCSLVRPDQTNPCYMLIQLFIFYQRYSYLVML